MTKIPLSDFVTKSGILLFLDSLGDPKSANLPHWRLHRLKGEREGLWAVDVSSSRLVIFRFTERHVEDIDLVDYH